MTLKLREADNKDIGNVIALIYQVLAEYGLPPDPDGTDNDLADIDVNYTNNGGYFGVVESDGELLATVGLLKIDADTCELRKMYSLKAFRGKGQGKWLLEQALEKARDLGFATIILETASVLTEAIALYKKMGFEQYQPRHLANRCDMALRKVL